MATMKAKINGEWVMIPSIKVKLIKEEIITPPSVEDTRELSLRFNSATGVIEATFGDKIETKTLSIYTGNSTIKPGTAATTIEANQFLNKRITISGDSNLKSENIKKGTSIFGVNGSYEAVVTPSEGISSIGSINPIVQWGEVSLTEINSDNFVCFTKITFNGEDFLLFYRQDGNMAYYNYIDSVPSIKSAEDFSQKLWQLDEAGQLDGTTPLIYYIVYQGVE